ncbi:MAG: hypothetical protein GY756_08095 [bacterium]|nr:hypothetical protein [bacterium]
MKYDSVTDYYFIAETILFQINANDKLKQVYSLTYGEGLFLSTVDGFWEFNDDETVLIFNEWDETIAVFISPVSYKIEELSKDKLVLLKEEDATQKIYIPKRETSLYKGNSVKLSEKVELLTSIFWMLDPNDTLNLITTTKAKNITRNAADIELNDVKAFADFLSETLKLRIDGTDKSKLAYSRTIGEGLFSSSVTGYWEFNADETAIILKECDKEAGAEKAPVTYIIEELTRDKLVLLKEGGACINVYFPIK